MARLRDSPKRMKPALLEQERASIRARIIILTTASNSKSKVRLKAPQITRAELNKLLGNWPVVMRMATDDWAKEFAFSVWNQSGRKGWLPSFRQTKVMRTMVREAQPFLH